jgi:hypothetical protein
VSRQPNKAGATHQQLANKSLHPTAYSPFVPHSLSAAGELGRCTAARGLAGNGRTEIDLTKNMVLYTIPSDIAANCD